MTAEQLGRRLEDIFLDWEKGNVTEPCLLGRIEALWEEWMLERLTDKKVK